MYKLWKFNIHLKLMNHLILVPFLIIGNYIYGYIRKE